MYHQPYGYEGRSPRHAQRMAPMDSHRRPRSSPRRDEEDQGSSATMLFGAAAGAAVVGTVATVCVVAAGGADGAAGKDGRDGATGTTGATGSAGSAGPAGTPGRDGSDADVEAELKALEESIMEVITEESEASKATWQLTVESIAVVSAHDGSNKGVVDIHLTSKPSVNDDTPMTMEDHASTTGTGFGVGSDLFFAHGWEDANDNNRVDEGEHIYVFIAGTATSDDIEMQAGTANGSWTTTEYIKLVYEADYGWTSTEGNSGPTITDNGSTFSLTGFTTDYKTFDYDEGTGTINIDSDIVSGIGRAIHVSENNKYFGIYDTAETGGSLKEALVFSIL